MTPQPVFAPALLRLLQLASPLLPVGAYSYSQGLEAAVETGRVSDARSAQAWIGEMLEYVTGRMEAPVLLRLCHAWRAGDLARVAAWNDYFVASRESAELRAETLQMGYSLRMLLERLLDAPALGALAEATGGEIAYPSAFAFAVSAWNIGFEEALLAYLWSWLENQVMAAVKTVPLGQTAGQQMLFSLGGRLAAVAAAAQDLGDEAIGAFAPQLALLSAGHETQYSRLFRS